MPPFEILKSEKNRDVLLVDGYLFWFDRATPRGRKYWKCIYCYRSYNGDVKNRCISRVITSPDDPNAMVCKNHNHEKDTVLVEHMKTFGSIRRLTSALRKSSMNSENKIKRIDQEPSTSQPLDLSIKKSANFGDFQKAKKRVLSDVLTSLYNRLHDPPSDEKIQKSPFENENSKTESFSIFSTQNLSSIFDNSEGGCTLVPTTTTMPIVFPELQPFSKQAISWNIFTLQTLFNLGQEQTHQIGSIDTIFSSNS